MKHDSLSPDPNPPDWPGDGPRRFWRDHHFPGHRPPWWPDNEEWPPRDRHHWRRMRRHNPFFRRFGFLFAIFNLFGLALFLAVVGLILNALGLTHFSIGQFQLVFLPVGGVGLALALVVLILGAVDLRRVSMPLDDLLEASHKVAEGDYSARVDERGPREVRSLAQAFNSMASRLEVNDRQRRAMLADVSHELRTPLTIIQGNLEAVLDGVYPADETRLKSLLEETQILSRLVEDLRTLSLAEGGSLQLKRESTEISVLIRETVAAFQSQAAAAGVKLELSLGAGALMLEADPERIRQVLTNLISNALRYSPRGSTIEIHLTESDLSAGRRAVVSVQDSGPGIAPQDLSHVFDRFYRSSDSRGMGLGLSIAKYIVEAHGGEIQAESAEGQGTTIWFSLPA